MKCLSDRGGYEPNAGTWTLRPRAGAVSPHPQSCPGGEVNDHLKFGIANGVHTLNGAFRLVHDQYVARGYMNPAPSGLRVGLHHALPWTKVLAARHGRRVVGTMTLIRDSGLGLPMDELFADELAPFRERGRRVTEVSALAIDPAYQTAGVAILTKLIRLLILYAVEIARYDDVCITVNPRHLGFYRRLFPDCYQIGEVKAYGKVNGAPAAALRLDLRLLRAVIASMETSAPGSGSPYEFFFRAEGFAAMVSCLQREAHRSRLTTTQFVRFFSGHRDLARATPGERALIQSLYPSIDLDTLADGSRLLLTLAAAPA